MENQEIDALRRALERERSARKIAEKILEEKSSELYILNQKLIGVNYGLEKRVEEATQKIELIARFPAENPFPVIRTDKFGQTIYLNKPAQNLIETLKKEGLNTEELLVSWAVDVSLQKSNIRRELESHSKKFIVAIVPIKVHDYVNYYFSEVTEQKLAEEKLISSEEKYRSVIENMKLGLLEINNEKIITKVYSQFCSITGYSENELLGKSVDQVYYVEPHEIANSELFREINEWSNYLLESRIKRKDGSFVWVLISSAVLFAKDGSLAGSIGIHLDISLQKENERELRSARLKAEDSTRAKEQFLANMSHEIRTPLNAISGMTDLLIKSNVNKEQAKLLNAMERSSENLLVVINDILDFSKIESGNLKFEKIGFKLTDVINHVILTKELHADEKNISLECDLLIDVDTVLIGDPFRLNQILLNFINNAIKFTEKGSVKITVRSIVQDEKQQAVKFNIADTGKGIEASKLESIFEAFHQEDDSITRSYGGTGLGLTITKKMIEMQGGLLSVSSEPNVGSDFQFVITYDIGEEQDLPAPKAIAIDPILLQGLKILIAEDNEFNQILMDTMFHQFDVDLTIVDNGLKVVELLEEQLFDIILMDIQMPVMGGVQATEIIRQGQYQKDIPIVALTANAFKDELDKYKGYGMNDCLSKPFNSDELYNKILELTGRVGCQVAIGNQINEDVPLYDLKKLGSMLGNNNDLILKMVQSFLKHTPPLLEELYSAAEDSNWNQVSKICHRLKASYKTMSIDSLESPIHLLEIETSSIPDNDRQKYLTSIRTVSSKVFEKLNKENFQ